MAYLTYSIAPWALEAFGSPTPEIRRLIPQEPTLCSSLLNSFSHSQAASWSGHRAHKQRTRVGVGGFPGD